MITLAQIALAVIDVGFAIAERVDAWSTKRKRKQKLPPTALSWKDVLEIKRQSDLGARKSEAPTVVIPPPSERDRQAYLDALKAQRGRKPR